MLANFRRHFTPDMRPGAQAAGLTGREAVTLASIVQKETSLDREEPLIAGVYWNRLRHRMRLQADPTVTYALKRDGRWTGTLYRSDYGYESPFNTYLVEGLPPGPICNPGVDALRAAVAPAQPSSCTSWPTDRRPHVLAHVRGAPGRDRRRAASRSAAPSRRRPREPPRPVVRPVTGLDAASPPPPRRRIPFEARPSLRSARASTQRSRPILDPRGERPTIGPTPR